MLPLTKTELAIEKMLRAANALEDHFRSGAHDSEKYKQLADAVKVAIDEVSDQLASITWIRREFHYFRSKLPEKTIFVSKIFAAVAQFSQA